MSETLTDNGFPPLSSFRLIVPPLQLFSAALLEVVKQGAVMYYGVLEEFITTVLETAPELLTDTERVKLVIGLRAKVVLELCCSDTFTDQQALQHHLSEMNTYIMNQDKETYRSEVKDSVVNFLKLVHTLIEDQCQTDAFYQNVFPTVFGPKYDSALQALMKKFLFNLQELLPVPSLEQTSLWLTLSPTILKDCVDFMNQPQPLKTLIQHHKHHGHKVPQAFSSSGDDCILSSLSIHLPNVENNRGHAKIKSEPMCDSQDWQIDDFLDGELKEDKEDVSKLLYPKLVSNVEEPGLQCVDYVAEDEGASVEVILPSFDETESSDDDHMDKKWSHHLKSGRRTSAKTFKCHVCGKDFSSRSRLNKHKITHCATKTMSQEDLASQRSSFEKIQLHCKLRSCCENEALRGETELSAFASAVPSPSCQNSRQNSELLNNDCSLMCHVCDKVFTCREHFEKHQRICADRIKCPKTDQQCSSSSTHLSELNAVDKTKFFLSETSNREPQEIPPHSSKDRKCKRDSRMKQCSVCKEIFTCSTDLIKHMRSHTERSPYLCSHCSEDFDSYENYETHKEDGKCEASKQHLKDFSSSNKNQGNYKNTILSSEISQTSTNADTPQDLKTRKPPLTCQECGLRFTYCMSFEKHQKKCSEAASQRRTSTNYLIICGCDLFSADNSHESRDEKSSETTESRTATTLFTADNAGGSEHKARTFRCSMCEISNFSKIELLKRHYVELHDFRGPYPCSLCKRSFLRLCELVRHQQNKPLFLCPICKKGFREPGEMKRHEKVHTARISVTPFVCETCGRSFKFRVNLIMHQRKHRERPPNVCSYCGKQFSSKDSLKAHMVRHTDGYPCPVCGKKFYQKTYLTYHLNRHTGQEKFLCETCGKGWPTAAQLKVHMVKHTEGRPFECNDCGATYKWESGLIAHHRAKHVGLRPFVCEICSKAFRINSELKKHMMVHTGERPYSCPMCGKKFTKSFNLKKHREKPCR